MDFKKVIKEKNKYLKRKQREKINIIPTKILFPPKQEFGQNFLFDKNYLQKIVASCPIDTNTVIIEIGSGYGSLTNLLATTACQKVISLEKDQDLFYWLTENNSNDKIIYLHQDALRINWPELCSQYQTNSLLIVGNLPYYITNSLIVDLLFHYHLFKSLVFLVQKEVGQKWVSSPVQYSSKYSALSAFINFLTKTKIAWEIPQQVFIPSPSVDGALVVIENNKSVDLSKEQLISFLRFLKNCFRFRRKTLLNNLGSFAGNWESEWKKYFAEKNCPPQIRPQNLTPQEFFELFLFYQQIKTNISPKF